jgi:hypothetical protein
VFRRILLFGLPESRWEIWQTFKERGIVSCAVGAFTNLEIHHCFRTRIAVQRGLEFPPIKTTEKFARELVMCGKEFAVTAKRGRFPGIVRAAHSSCGGNES